MLVKLTLDKDKVVRVVGPARIDVRKGSVLLVGAIYGEGKSLVIHRMRSYALKAMESTELQIMLGSGASVEEPQNGEEVINEWLRISDSILEDTRSTGKAKIIILGPVESGKTTLSAFVTNRLLSGGYKVGLIDADIGQEDVAIPATVALTIPKQPFIWQRELSPHAIRFVGCIAPQYCQESILAGVRDLVRIAEEHGCNAVVVNTDGWVGNYSALSHKISMIRWTRPTHVLVLDDQLFRYVSRALPKGIKVINAPKPVKVRERSREERRNLRSEAYRRYFSNAREVRINIDEIGIINSYVLVGDEVKVDEVNNLIKSQGNLRNYISYASTCFGTLNVVVDDHKYREVSSLGQLSRDVNVVKLSDFQGLIVGILNSKLEDVAVGIIKSVDLKNRSITLVTPWSGDIEAIIIGKVKISLDTFEDSARLGRCTI